MTIIGHRIGELPLSHPSPQGPGHNLYAFGGPLSSLHFVSLCPSVLVSLPSFCGHHQVPPFPRQHVRWDLPYFVIHFTTKGLNEGHA
jgi:hypothetical protein